MSEPETNRRCQNPLLHRFHYTSSSPQMFSPMSPKHCLYKHHLLLIKRCLCTAIWIYWDYTWSPPLQTLRGCRRHFLRNIEQWIGCSLRRHWNTTIDASHSVHSSSESANIRTGKTSWLGDHGRTRWRRKKSIRHRRRARCPWTTWRGIVSCIHFVWQLRTEGRG